MKILALDTATEACSVALITDADVIGRWREVGRGHAEEILGMVDTTLAEAGVTLGSLDAIASSVGPGSFTGVRICVSVAQGLAFGAGLPVLAITTLEALSVAALHDGADQVLACLDARMGEVYWGCFRAHPDLGVLAEGGLAVSRPEAVSVPFAGMYHGIGRGFAAYPLLAGREGLLLPAGACAALPDARHMASLGVIRLRAGQALDPAELKPTYLRDKVAQTEVERTAGKITES